MLWIRLTLMRNNIKKVFLYQPYNEYASLLLSGVMKIVNFKFSQHKPTLIRQRPKITKNTEQLCCLTAWLLSIVNSWPHKKLFPTEPMLFRLSTCYKTWWFWIQSLMGSWIFTVYEFHTTTKYLISTFLFSIVI